MCSPFTNNEKDFDGIPEVVVENWTLLPAILRAMSAEWDVGRT